MKNHDEEIAKAKLIIKKLTFEQDKVFNELLGKFNILQDSDVDFLFDYIYNESGDITYSQYLKKFKC